MHAIVLDLVYALEAMLSLKCIHFDINFEINFFGGFHFWARIFGDVLIGILEIIHVFLHWIKTQMLRGLRLHKRIRLISIRVDRNSDLVLVHDVFVGSVVVSLIAVGIGRVLLHIFANCWLVKHTFLFRAIINNNLISLCGLLHWNIRLDRAIILYHDWLVQILELAGIRVPIPTLGHLEYRNKLFEDLDWHVVDFWVLQVHIMVLLLATTANLLRLQLHPVHLARVLHKLNVPMKALRAPLHLALIQLGLRVAPVVLTPVAARGEGLVAEMAFEGLLPGMHPLMHLEIRLVQEFTAAGAFFSWNRRETGQTTWARDAEKSKKNVLWNGKSSTCRSGQCHFVHNINHKCPKNCEL